MKKSVCSFNGPFNVSEHPGYWYPFLNKGAKIGFEPSESLSQAIVDFCDRRIKHLLESGEVTYFDPFPIVGTMFSIEDESEPYVNQKFYRDVIYRMIESECRYQDEKWGGAGHDGILSLGDWLIFMEQYLNKAKVAWSSDDPDRFEETLKRIKQVATLGVRALEYNDDIDVDSWQYGFDEDSDRLWLKDPANSEPFWWSNPLKWGGRCMEALNDLLSNICDKLNRGK